MTTNTPVVRNCHRREFQHFTRAFASTTNATKEVPVLVEHQNMVPACDVLSAGVIKQANREFALDHARSGSIAVLRHNN